MAESYSVMWPYHSLFICSFVARHLHCFHFWQLWIMLGRIVILRLTCWRTFHSWCTILQYLQQIVTFHCCLNSCPVSVKWHVIAALIFISFLTNCVEYLSCACLPFEYLFGALPAQGLCAFSMGPSPCGWVVSFRYVCWTLDLDQMYDFQAFLLFCGWW